MGVAARSSDLKPLPELESSRNCYGNYSRSEHTQNAAARLALLDQWRAANPAADRRRSPVHGMVTGGPRAAALPHRGRRSSAAQRASSALRAGGRGKREASSSGPPSAPPRPLVGTVSAAYD